MIKPARICVGKIATAHGVRGLVKVHCFADDPDVLQACGPLYTSDNGDKTLTLTLKNATNTHWLASVEGIADKTAADKLRGTELYLDRDALPDLEDGYYHADLIGLPVQNENGDVIGEVAAVDNFGAGDLFDIKPVSGHNFFVPFAPDYAIVDEDKNIVTIRNYAEFKNDVIPAKAGISKESKRDPGLRRGDNEEEE